MDYKQKTSLLVPNAREKKLGLCFCISAHANGEAENPPRLWGGKKAELLRLWDLVDPQRHKNISPQKTEEAEGIKNQMTNRRRWKGNRNQMKSGLPPTVSAQSSVPKSSFLCSDTKPSPLVLPSGSTPSPPPVGPVSVSWWLEGSGGSAGICSFC